MNYTSSDNIISSEDMDNENGFSSTMLTFAAVMTFMIMFVGIFGNFLTVAALVKCPKVRNVAAAFIISLCLADLIFCALVLPFSALRFIQGTWTHGDVLCKLIPFIQYGNIGVSLLCIAMITVNRYVMIAHHSSYGKIYKKHWIAIMIAFCWLFSYGMQLPTLFGVWGKFDYDPRLGTCSIMNDENGNSSKTALFVTAFIIPCMIIIACYAKIFWVVHKSELRMKKHANKQNSIPNNLRPTPQTSTETNGQQHRISTTGGASDSSFSTDVIKPEALQKPSRIKDQREVRAKRNEWRITKMVLAIFMSFVICYLPITIAKVADKDVDHPGFHIFSYIMLYLSACINPIIYVIMNKQYRKAYKTVIMCEPSRLLPFGKATGGGAAGAGGGSSVAEKWKDTGLSNNHSRTIVSQMSSTAADQQNTSLSSSQPNHQQPPSISLEMTTKATSIQSEKVEMPNVSPTAAVAAENDKQPSTTMATATTSSTQNDAGHIKGTIAAVAATLALLTNNTNRGPTNKEPTTISTTTNRIALVGGDIILEEEEEMADFSTDQRPAEENVSTAVPTERSQRQIRAANVPAPPPRKTPYYGQNINVIPDNNNAKLITKQQLQI